MMHTGQFELRIDENTGRRSWWGSEEGWKAATEIGESGVLTIDAAHFAPGTVLRLEEPDEEEETGEMSEHAEPVCCETPMIRCDGDDRPGHGHHYYLCLQCGVHTEEIRDMEDDWDEDEAEWDDMPNVGRMG